MPTRPSKSNTFVIQSDMPTVEHCAIPMRLPTRLHRYGHLVPCSGNGVMIDVSRPTRTVLAALSFDRNPTPTATLCDSFSAPAAAHTRQRSPPHISYAPARLQCRPPASPRYHHQQPMRLRQFQLRSPALHPSSIDRSTRNSISIAPGCRRPAPHTHIVNRLNSCGTL